MKTQLNQNELNFENKHLVINHVDKLNPEN